MYLSNKAQSNLIAHRGHPGKEKTDNSCLGRSESLLASQSDNRLL